MPVASHQAAAGGGCLPNPVRRSYLKLSPQTSLHQKPPHLASAGSGSLSSAPTLRAYGGLSSPENHLSYWASEAALCPLPRWVNITWLDGAVLFGACLSGTELMLWCLRELPGANEERARELGLDVLQLA